MTLLHADQVSKRYGSTALIGPRATRIAVDTVSLAIDEGETVALLGRSGCGKSTLARLICGLEQPDSGQILYRGMQFHRLPAKEKLSFRREIQLVFQDPPGAVNPRFDIRAIICEPLRHLTDLDIQGRETRLRHLLDMVELPSSVADMLPSQLSGGQLQRVCIARALAPGPKLIILDEAVSNLDIHLQVNTLSLLSRLQRSEGISYLFVSHDLRLVERFAGRVVIMDNSRVVEEGISADLAHLQHPASRLLRQAVLPALPSRQRPSGHTERDATPMTDRSALV